jgi:hypothetical protein
MHSRATVASLTCAQLLMIFYWSHEGRRR